MTLRSHRPLKRTIWAPSVSLGSTTVKRSCSCKNATSGCPLSSSSELYHIFFPLAVGSEMAVRLSAPKAFIVLQGLTQSHRKPRSTLSQHLLMWLNAMNTETKAYFRKALILITAAPAFPRQLLGTCDNPAFVSRALCWKRQENILVKPDFWRWLLAQRPESGNH